MGEAKRRGTFEERKAAATERDVKWQAAMVEIKRRKPSPKHTTLMAIMAGLAVAMNAENAPRKQRLSR